MKDAYAGQRNAIRKMAEDSCTGGMAFATRTVLGKKIRRVRFPAVEPAPTAERQRAILRKLSEGGPGSGRKQTDIYYGNDVLAGPKPNFRRVAKSAPPFGKAQNLASIAVKAHAAAGRAKTPAGKYRLAVVAQAARKSAKTIRKGIALQVKRGAVPSFEQQRSAIKRMAEGGPGSGRHPGSAPAAWRSRPGASGQTQMMRDKIAKQARSARKFFKGKASGNNDGVVWRPTMMVGSRAYSVNQATRHVIRGKIKAAKSYARNWKADINKSMGLVKVKGALGGTYWENQQPAGRRSQEMRKDIYQSQRDAIAQEAASRSRFLVGREACKPKVIKKLQPKFEGKLPPALAAYLAKKNGGKPAADVDKNADDKGKGKKVKTMPPWLAAKVGKPGKAKVAKKG
jgi:hypothetical protein